MIASSPSAPLRIGMIGGGTVGGGVYEILMSRLGGSAAAAAAAAAGAASAAAGSESGASSSDAAIVSSSASSQLPMRRPCVITKICVRDTSKPRTFVIDDAHTKLVSDASDVLEDEDIDVVVEVMGGTGLAKTVVLEALRRGKSVVTANKALIAEHLDEIRDAVLLGQQGTGGGRGGGDGNVRFAYEAAVCGGIPIIHTLQTCYAGDVVHEIMGICNGTTNYMLGKMETGSADYDDVLKEAQDLGYAESDPTADVEGHDVRAKIAILAKLAFGTTVPIDSIPCAGISRISSVDFEYAKLLGCTVKLVGTAARLSKFGERDGPLTVYVSPKMVPQTHLLASTRGCGNAVSIESANLGIASYTGPGAGRYPTANSVVADICRVASGTCAADPFASPCCDGNGGGNGSGHRRGDGIDLDPDYTSPFYVRIAYEDGLGIVRKVGDLAERRGVSIYSVLQNPIIDRAMADFVVTTERCKLSQVMAMCDDIAREDFVRGPPLCMPLLMEFY